MKNEFNNLLRQLKERDYIKLFYRGKIAKVDEDTTYSQQEHDKAKIELYDKQETALRSNYVDIMRAYELLSNAVTTSSRMNTTAWDKVKSTVELIKTFPQDTAESVETSYMLKELTEPFKGDIPALKILSNTIKQCGFTSAYLNGAGEEAGIISDPAKELENLKGIVQRACSIRGSLKVADRKIQDMTTPLGITTDNYTFESDSYDNKSTASEMFTLYNLT